MSVPHEAIMSYAKHVSHHHGLSLCNMRRVWPGQSYNARTFFCVHYLKGRHDWMNSVMHIYHTKD
jgi:hypothetical protein